MVGSLQIKVAALGSCLLEPPLAYTPPTSPSFPPSWLILTPPTPPHSDSLPPSMGLSIHFKGYKGFITARELETMFHSHIMAIDKHGSTFLIPQNFNIGPTGLYRGYGKILRKTEMGPASQFKL